MGTAFLWLTVPQLWLRLKEKSLTSTASQFLATPPRRTACVLALVCALPLALAIQSHWIVRGTNAETCRYFDIGRKVALAIPDHAKLAVVAPKDDGFFSYVVNFELALSEALGGNSAAVAERFNDVTSLSTLQQELLSTGKADAILLRDSPPYELANSVLNNRGENQTPTLLLLKGRAWQRLD